MEAFKRNEQPFKIAVLDDDPTGIQTVHDVYVYTDWEISTLREAFKDSSCLFYILTNSRSFGKKQTEEVHRTIARRLLAVSGETNIPFLVILRGDSTLRGHYLLEPEVMEQVFLEEGGLKTDGEILCPAFFEGGRCTKDDIHYVEENGSWTEAAKTEYARDRTFGYRSSNLREFIEEKTGGRVKRENCISVSTQLLESGTEDCRLDELLKSAKDGQKIVVNAVCYSQLERFSVSFWRAVKQGKWFTVRSGASLVKAISGIKAKPFLTGRELLKKGTKSGGLIIAGSHVERTTRQLAELENSIHPYCFIEFQADAALRDGELRKEIQEVRKRAEQAISWGRDAVVYTSRRVLCREEGEESLNLSVRISEALTSVVRELSVSPSYIIAKGGITSSDVGTRGLGVKKALALGQAAPGVPVWLTGKESRFPGMPYIIFPGNEGTDQTLRQIADSLAEERGSCT